MIVYPAMIQIGPKLTTDKLAIRSWVLFSILSAEAIGLFALRLAGILQFDNFAFFDTGSNLTVQYLISQGFRPTIDFAYHYGLLPLVLGRIWFSIFGLTPIACVSAMLLIDILIVWAFVRFAVHLRLDLAGVFLIMMTASLTIPSSFLNLAHGIEPVFLLHSLADQGAGDRRRALAFATAALFVKPSMAFFLGFVLLCFTAIKCFRCRERPLKAFTIVTAPAILVGIVIASILASYFGPAIVIRSMIPSEGLAMYRAQGFGFFNGAGRSLIAPQGAPLTYYFANIAGLWIVYTVVLVWAALVVTRRVVTSFGSVRQEDRIAEMILICAILHLSFVLFFFGNEFSWVYYFYIPVLGLAAAARLGTRWKVLIICLAFVGPVTKIDKRIIQRLSSSRQTISEGSRGYSSGTPLIAALPTESNFTYQLWYTTFRSRETAGLWVAPAERIEWIKVITMIRGRHTAMLEYYGCADLLFSEFRPPVTLFLVPGGVTENVLSRKLLQLRTSSMIVMPRWHRGLLDDIPEIGELVRREFLPIFQGNFFIIYAKIKQ